MRQTTHYSQIKRIEWEFDSSEVQKALMKANKIPDFDPKRKRIEFECSSNGALLIEVFVDDKKDEG